MKAGRLRHRVVIERPDVSRTGTGDEVVTWRTLATVWAAVEPLRGSEALKSAQILAELDTRITVRWSPLLEERLTAKCRVRHAPSTGATIYNIAHLVHVTVGQREIQILCKSGANQS